MCVASPCSQDCMSIVLSFPFGTKALKDRYHFVFIFHEPS